MVNDVGFCFQQRKIARRGAKAQRKRLLAEAQRRKEIFTLRRRDAEKKIARRGAETQRKILLAEVQRRKEIFSQRG